jgi:hypothetical protein
MRFVAVALMILWLSYICVDFGDGSYIERVIVWNSETGQVISCERNVGPGPDGHCDACAVPDLLPCPARTLFDSPRPEIRHAQP